MILSCPSCEKTYRVPAAALPPGGREVRCSVCQTVWWERGAMAEAVAAGAQGADIAPRYYGAADAETGPVIETSYDAEPRPEPRPEPGPAPATTDNEPQPSPAGTGFWGRQPGEPAGQRSRTCMW